MAVIIGDETNQTLTGTNQADSIFGDTRSSIFNDTGGTVRASDDVLFGRQGNDRLVGDADDDFLTFYNFVDDGPRIIVGGDDELWGDQGADTLIGDAGDDFRAVGADDEIHGGHDELRGGQGKDLLIGDAGGDMLALEPRTKIVGGNDRLYGGEGKDTLVGDAGGKFTASTGAGDNGAEIVGGDDHLEGGDGDDWIYGDARGDAFASTGDSVSGGHDTLIGGPGDDHLWGDFGGSRSGSGTVIGGNDTFVFAPGDGNDIIYDFEAGEGESDRLDVRAFGFASAEAVIALATDDGAGNTVIDLGQNTTVTLLGVEQADLAADDIWFA